MKFWFPSHKLERKISIHCGPDWDFDPCCPDTNCQPDEFCGPDYDCNPRE